MNPYQNPFLATDFAVNECDVLRFSRETVEQDQGELSELGRDASASRNA